MQITLHKILHEKHEFAVVNRHGDKGRAKTVHDNAKAGDMRRYDWLITS